MDLDMSKVEAFAGQVVSDIAATFSGVMTSIGHKLGLYKALAEHGAMEPSKLAELTRTEERYVQEWLNNQVAGEYLRFDANSGNYELPAEHVPVLANDESPVFLVPALDVAASLWLDEEKVVEVFRSGEGIPWGDHHHRLFCGSEALFRPGYKAHLTASWIAALDGVQEKLRVGAKVADVGCGHGASTIVMAQQFPESTFYGFDSHPESIEIARQRSREAGVEANTRFEVRSAKEYEESDFDLICFMDCLHDMGDPIGAADHARRSLREDGSVLLVEPAANDELVENINPVSRLYYAASTAVCTPSSMAQEVGLALGAQAGERRLRQVMEEAGFARTRRAADTPFNIVLDCRPS